jgi:hypothetical protein
MNQGAGAGSDGRGARAGGERGVLELGNGGGAGAGNTGPASLVWVNRGAPDTTAGRHAKRAGRHAREHGGLINLGDGGGADGAGTSPAGSGGAVRAGSDPRAAENPGNVRKQQAGGDAQPATGVPSAVGDATGGSGSIVSLGSAVDTRRSAAKGGSAAGKAGKPGGAADAGRSGDARKGDSGRHRRANSELVGPATAAPPLKAGDERRDHDSRSAGAPPFGRDENGAFIAVFNGAKDRRRRVVDLGNGHQPLLDLPEGAHGESHPEDGQDTPGIRIGHVADAGPGERHEPDSSAEAVVAAAVDGGDAQGARPRGGDVVPMVAAARGEDAGPRIPRQRTGRHASPAAVADNGDGGAAAAVHGTGPGVPVQGLDGGAGGLAGLGGEASLLDLVYGRTVAPETSGSSLGQGEAHGVGHAVEAGEHEAGEHETGPSLPEHQTAAEYQAVPEQQEEASDAAGAPAAHSGQASEPRQDAPRYRFGYDDLPSGGARWGNADPGAGGWHDWRPAGHNQWRTPRQDYAWRGAPGAAVGLPVAGEDAEDAAEAAGLVLAGGALRRFRRA